jgi:hypothetical protein
MALSKETFPKQNNPHTYSTSAIRFLEENEKKVKRARVMKAMLLVRNGSLQKRSGQTTDLFQPRNQHGLVYQRAQPGAKRYFMETFVAPDGKSAANIKQAKLLQPKLNFTLVHRREMTQTGMDGVTRVAFEEETGDTKSVLRAKLKMNGKNGTPDLRNGRDNSRTVLNLYACQFHSKGVKGGDINLQTVSLHPTEACPLSCKINPITCERAGEDFPVEQHFDCEWKLKMLLRTEKDGLVKELNQEHTMKRKREREEERGARDESRKRLKAERDEYNRPEAVLSDSDD